MSISEQYELISQEMEKLEKRKIEFMINEIHKAKKKFQHLLDEIEK